MAESNKLLEKAVQGIYFQRKQYRVYTFKESSTGYIKMTNVQKQNPKNPPNTKKTVTKMEKTVKFVDNKTENNKNDSKTHKKKWDLNYNKKDKTNNYDSATEIQVNDIDTSIETEDNDSTGWRSLPEMPLTTEDSDTCDTDETEWIFDTFHQTTHTVSNLEYAKLKLSNFAVVNLHECDPIIALFHTGAICSYIVYQLVTKISDKVDIIKKTLWLNMANGATLTLIGIVQLTMNERRRKQFQAWLYYMY